MVKVEEKITNLIEEKIKKIGYQLYDIIYEKEGKDYYLRIYIDKEDGISIEDCESVNNEINDIIDKADYIKDAYFLEVSSPGLERLLRKEEHFKWAIGKKVRIKLYKAIENQKEWIGTLEKYTPHTITVENRVIERNNIALIKTVYDF